MSMSMSIHRSYTLSSMKSVSTQCFVAHIVLNNIGDPESGVTMTEILLIALNNVREQNIAQTLFLQHFNSLFVFTVLE